MELNRTTKTGLPVMITLEEFCEATRLTASSVYRLKCHGRLPLKILNVGRRILFDRDEVLTWMANGCEYLPIMTPTTSQKK